MKKKISRFISIVLAAVFLIIPLGISVNAEEQSQSSDTVYYLGETVKTGWDNGYVGSEKIKEGDPHFNWKIGEFFVTGFTSVADKEDKIPVFLKNVNDKVKLVFRLEQNIDKLNGDEQLTISEDSNGRDEYFSIPKTDFKRGSLIIRKTDYTNSQNDPVVYTDYLHATASKDADTQVELCEEGDYEVALDYEIKKDPRKVFDISIIPEFSNYRIFFRFSVRNGNCMVYPFDIKTKGELSNTSVTENGFYLDLANSRYLNINIKKEVLNEGANGLTEDVRFNRPAKDGEQYTDEGIYTITVSNQYNGQLTTKKIYVGTDDVLKAVAATGLSVKEVKDYLNDGATVEKDGAIRLSTNEVKRAANSGAPIETKATGDSAESVFENIPLMWWVIGGVGLLLVILVIVVIIATAKKKKKKYVNIEAFTDDKEV